MKRVLFAVAVVQSVSLARPLAGTVMYLASRGSHASQRHAVAAALRDPA